MIFIKHSRIISFLNTPLNEENRYQKKTTKELITNIF